MRRAGLAVMRRETVSAPSPVKAMRLQGLGHGEGGAGPTPLRAGVPVLHNHVVDPPQLVACRRQAGGHDGVR